MSDAVSRTSGGIGTMVIVPAAGVIHAASGIGEAYLDGILLLVIVGGIHSESDFKHQLHDIDQHNLLEPITKGVLKLVLFPKLFLVSMKRITWLRTGSPAEYLLKFLSIFKSEPDLFLILQSLKKTLVYCIK